MESPAWNAASRIRDGTRRNVMSMDEAKVFSLNPPELSLKPMV